MGGVPGATSGPARREPCAGELRTEAPKPQPVLKVLWLSVESPLQTQSSGEAPAQGRTGVSGVNWCIGGCVPVL